MQWTKDPENHDFNEISDEEQQEENYNDIEMECTKNEDMNEGYVEPVAKPVP